MNIEKLASQIKNDLLSGLRGYYSNLSLNIQQLEDEIVQTRLVVVKQLIAKNQLALEDCLIAINCIDVNCSDLERCSKCVKTLGSTPTAHFEIPQLLTDFGVAAIQYIGPTDRKENFSIISSPTEFKLKKYRKRGVNKPYVWIDLAPNQNGMLDCFIFNAPFMKQISIVAAFKDPRQLKHFSCCAEELTNNNISIIDQMVKDQLLKEKIQYYRQLAAPIVPNNQQYKTGN